ncbi:peptidylprolyl isomerase [Streptomyces zagrosensis]|uniref:Peptidyl-prolyl cis-trans isomerase B (Cyclophilin B) n=1 Tax=Streptomyces zagrosensis TaxID=1042984 RepID=A0A7W9Q8R2_9ACTN|nr:peptidylprolyl isomerase [Streptomyces zagrosensis]MBB5935616.1 peptidyl-prolyl cis-trans isomerase B (cyclophilin B) [Streptomyces zagrosensis]
MVSQDQRRRQLAREKLERQQQRRTTAQTRGRRRNIVIASSLALVLAAGVVAYAATSLGGDSDDKSDRVSEADKGKDSAKSKADEKAKAAKADPCGKPAPGAPAKLSWKKEPKLTIDTSADYTMNLGTTCGDITIDLDAKNAPHTVNSFNFLAGKGYFNHTRCHRLTNQGIYVLQCGDPNGNGTGSPGYTIPDENLKDPKLKGNVYPAGTIAMANRYNPKPAKGESKNENSGGSQFFVVYQDSELPPYYTPFGTLKGNKNALKKITDAGAMSPDPQTGNTAPKATVVINKATVKQS